MKKIIGLLLIILIVCFYSNSYPQESKKSFQMNITKTNDPNYVAIETDPNKIKIYKTLDIAKIIPESDFDKSIHRAIIIMFYDLYDLTNKHNKNMGLISEDINKILKKFKRFQEDIEILELRLDLLKRNNQ